MSSGAGHDAIYILLTAWASPGVVVDLSGLWTGGEGRVGTSRIINVEAIPYTIYGSQGDDTITIVSGIAKATTAPGRTPRTCRRRSCASSAA